MPVQRSFVRGGRRDIGGREGSGDGLDGTGGGSGRHPEQARQGRLDGHLHGVVGVQCGSRRNRDEWDELDVLQLGIVRTA